MLNTKEIDEDLKKAQQRGLVRTTYPVNKPAHIGIWGRYLRIYFGFRPIPKPTTHLNSFGYL